jgi:hypothetical protein
MNSSAAYHQQEAAAIDDVRNRFLLAVAKL